MKTVRPVPLKRFYLVDFENVASDGLKGVKELPPHAEVLVFSSTRSNKMTYDIVEELLASPAEVVFFSTQFHKAGDQSVDKMLLLKLGELSVLYPNSLFYIVSGDKGYCRPVKEILPNIKVRFTRSLRPNAIRQDDRSSTSVSPIQWVYESVLSSGSEYEAKWVQSLLVRWNPCVPSDRAEINNELIRYYSVCPKGKKRLRYINSLIKIYRSNVA